MSFTDLNENEALVIHHGYGDYLRPVAKLSIPDGVGDDRALEHIFKQTNTIDKFWTENAGVKVSHSVMASRGARSTSVGDLILFREKLFEVSTFGFDEVSPKDIADKIDDDIEGVEVVKLFLDGYGDAIDTVQFDLDTSNGTDKHYLSLDAGQEGIMFSLEPSIFKNLNRVADRIGTIIPHLKDTVDGALLIKSRVNKKVLKP